MEQVWPEDLKDGAQEGFGVESVCDVAERVGRLVRSLEVHLCVVQRFTTIFVTLGTDFVHVCGGV